MQTDMSTNAARIYNGRLRFFALLRMTKLSFVIGEFISGWSHEAWMKIVLCGSLINE